MVIQVKSSYNNLVVRYQLDDNHNMSGSMTESVSSTQHIRTYETITTSIWIYR